MIPNWDSFRVNSVLSRTFKGPHSTKMKRDTHQKSSPFLRKKTAFLSGVSLHFRPFLVFWSGERPTYQRGPFYIQYLVDNIRGLNSMRLLSTELNIWLTYRKVIRYVVSETGFRRHNAQWSGGFWSFLYGGEGVWIKKVAQFYSKVSNEKKQ